MKKLGKALTALSLKCPQCDSRRVQRDYDDTAMVARMAGLHRVLCNNCGTVFKAFDPLQKLRREVPDDETAVEESRRRTPRYYVHFPAAISLVEGNSGLTTYSEPSRGHCESISKLGLGLSFVGTRISEFELTRKGRLLFVRIDLPEASIEVVTKIINYRRTGEAQKRKWQLNVMIHQISEEDTEKLTEYLKQRRETPIILSD